MEGPLIPVIIRTLLPHKDFLAEVKPDRGEPVGAVWVIFLTPEEALKYKVMAEDVIVEKDSFTFITPENILTWKRPFL